MICEAKVTSYAMSALLRLLSCCQLYHKPLGFGCIIPARTASYHGCLLSALDYCVYNSARNDWLLLLLSAWAIVLYQP